MSKTRKRIESERQKLYSDLTSGKGYSLHRYHYGRLLSLGMGEREAADEIFATAATIEALLAKGVRFNEQAIVRVYASMPIPPGDEVAGPANRVTGSRA